jgi:putative oxidoreductase
MMWLMIWNYLNRYRDFGLLLLRVGLGGMFIWHGAPKIFGGPEFWAKIGPSVGNFGIHFLPVFWGFMAGVAEFVGGLCIVLGLFFRIATPLLVIQMTVASSYHLAAGQGLGGASHAIEDGIVFLSLFFIGPGKYSLDELLSAKKMS